MTPVFLKFTDATAALAAFNAVLDADADTLTDVPPVVFVSGLPVYIDVVFGTGVVMRTTGETETDAMGNEVPVMAPLPGFHVNLLLPDGLPLPEALASYQIHPVNPAVVFAA